MTISNIPSLRSIWPVVETEKAAFNYLKDKGIFWILEFCDRCGGNISIHGIGARCTTKSCRKGFSCLKHSFFAKSKLGVHDVLLLGYLWISSASYTTALTMTTHSSGTISDYYHNFRELVGDSLDESDWFIGGEDVIVEVDESKFGKRKHNRGKHVEGAWVVGGIERTEEKKFFVVVVKKRDSETLCNVLFRHIKPGSIVHTDCWKGYIGIDNIMDVSHKKVNHSMWFVDNETGVHTNSIEGKWAALKRRITLRGRVADTLPGYLFEQIWRNIHKDTLWNSFITALKEVYYE